MKIRKQLIVIILFLEVLALLYYLIFYSIASVSSAPLYQSTSTSTFWPLFPSNTPEPSRQHCNPGGQTPVGWGTVTPNPFWMASCGDCVGFSATVTGTPGSPEPTVTQGATSTPTITPTPYYTPTLSNTAQIKVQSIWTKYDPFNWLTVSGYIQCENELGQTFSNSYNQTSTLYGEHITCIADIYTSKGNLGNTYLLAALRVWSDPGSAPVYFYTNVDIQLSGCPGASTSEYNMQGYGSYMPSQYSQVDIGSQCDHGTTSYSGEQYMYIEISRWDLSTPVPTLEPSITPTVSITPMFTPSGDEECYAVRDDTGGGVGGYQSDMFGWIPPSRGSGQCLTWYEFDLGTWLGVDVYVPDGSICMVPVTFGSVLLFEIEIPLDYTAGIMISIMVIRWLWRS